jgi:hypothetical protein
MPISLGTRYSTRKISLVTREENAIDNEQQLNLSNSLLTDLQGKAKKCREQYKTCTFLVDYSPAYNCHGLAFACRRTAIHDSKDLRTILEDDCYEKVQDNDVKPGDIVLYISTGDIEHSGIVVGTGGAYIVPLIRSKWGIGPEAIHHANVCPYDFTYHEFYRVVK